MPRENTISLDIHLVGSHMDVCEAMICYLNDTGYMDGYYTGTLHPGGIECYDKNGVPVNHSANFEEAEEEKS